MENPFVYFILILIFSTKPQMLYHIRQLNFNLWNTSIRHRYVTGGTFSLISPFNSSSKCSLIKLGLSETLLLCDFWISYHLPPCTLSLLYSLLTQSVSICCSIAADSSAANFKVCPRTRGSLHGPVAVWLRVFFLYFSSKHTRCMSISVRRFLTHFHFPCLIRVRV